jgi:hypothetical protein
MKRFARSLVQFNDMMGRYSEPELAPDDIEQTGTEEDRSREEPAPTNWVNSTVAPSTADNNTDDVSNSASSDGE